MKFRSKAQHLPAPSPGAGARPWRGGSAAFVWLLLLLLSVSRPAAAQGTPPAAPNGIITVFSGGTGTDQVAVSYEKVLPAAQVQQDFANLGASLGHAPAIPAIRTDAGFSTAQAEVSGLTDWKNGVVNVDALIRTFVRFGHFHIYCFFARDFPLQSTEPIRNGPIIVLVHRDAKNGTVTDFEVFIDQSQVNPAHPPQVNRQRGINWLVWVALGVLSLVVFASVFLLINSFLTRRKAQE